MKGRDLVPAARFAQIIEARLEHYEGRGDEDPMSRVVEESRVAWKIIQRIREGQSKIEFSTADRIVTYCTAAGPMLWHSDEELHEIYMAVDLIDWEHGTRTGYVKHDCRCAPCKQANTDYSRRYMQARKAAA